MKILMIPIAAILLILGCRSSSERDNKAPGEAVSATSKEATFTGEYTYGPGGDKGPTGDIIIFPKDDSTLLFAIDLSIGPPSYNMGELFDTLRLKNNQAIYKKSADGDNGCKWQIDFYNDSLTIKTLDDAYDCGFGAGVIADGSYKLADHKVPNLYITQDGDTVYRAK